MQLIMSLNFIWLSKFLANGLTEFFFIISRQSPTKNSLRAESAIFPKDHLCVKGVRCLFFLSDRLKS